MTENEAVNEVISDEMTDRTMSQVLNEMAAMVVLNQALNNALWIASDKLGKANAARDNAIIYMNDKARELQDDIVQIVQEMTRGGTHRDKDEAQLQAIAKLMVLMRNIFWHASKTGGIAREEITNTRDTDDIPF